jgi:hypothetical protein
MLLKRTPFTPVEVERLSDWLAASDLMELAAAPGVTAATPNMYEAFLSLGDPLREARFVSVYPFDISPVVDDRPFFFRRSFWWHLFPTNPMVAAATPAMEYGLLLLLAIVGVATVVCVYLPLGWHRPARGPATHRFALFFAAIGIGYLALEIALLQRFGLFLGHPNLALSVVLAALLLFTGVGSLLSGATLARLRGLRFVAYAVAAVVLLEYLLALPRLERLFALPLGVRVGIVAVLVAPIGFLLGTFMPTGLDRLKAVSPDLAPWAWGVNGIFSVLTPIVAVGISMTFGISALLLSAIPVYLLAGLVLPPTRAAGS